MSRDRIELFHDHFQNYKLYNIPKAQLVLTDIPYNVGVNAYGSNPQWYVDGDNKNGASKLAGTNHPGLFYVQPLHNHVVVIKKLS